MSVFPPTYHYHSLSACQSIFPYVCPSVRPSVSPSVPFFFTNHHRSPRVTTQNPRYYTYRVIPDGPEAQDFAVHLDKLPELVEAGRCRRVLGFEALDAALGVRIFGDGFGGVDGDAFALQEVFGEFVGVAEAEHFAVENYVNADVQILS